MYVSDSISWLPEEATSKARPGPAASLTSFGSLCNHLQIMHLFIQSSHISASNACFTQHQLIARNGHKHTPAQLLLWGTPTLSFSVTGRSTTCSLCICSYRTPTFLPHVSSTFQTALAESLLAAHPAPARAITVSRNKWQACAAFLDRHCGLGQQQNRSLKSSY